MYQSYDVMDPTSTWAPSSFAVLQTPGAPVAGGASVRLSAAALSGMWALRFGSFGCSDSETRGGVVAVAPGRLLGGDSHFPYEGEWTLDGTELTASLRISRHGVNADLPTVLGTLENSYELDVVAEAITPELFEGRLRRPGYPDVRVVMRRVPGVVAAS